MDFKIGDEIEGYGETEPKKKRSSFFSILVVIIVSLSVGFIVYFVCNAIFVKNEANNRIFGNFYLILHDVMPKGISI